MNYAFKYKKYFLGIFYIAKNGNKKMPKFLFLKKCPKIYGKALFHFFLIL
jgi:hypothetical protein